MGKKSISKKRQKRKRKVSQPTSHATLAALDPVMQDKGIFEPIHEQVEIDQKTIDYRPTDKLVLATLGFVAGAQTVSALNQVLRPNRPLLLAFGYKACADQSVKTLDAATDENVNQLQLALSQIWQSHNQVRSKLSHLSSDEQLTVDIDLSGLPASRRCEKSSKGYFAGKKNQTGRQLARVLVPETEELVCQSLYPGNTQGCHVLQSMIDQMEETLGIDSKPERERIRIRFDGGFGTPKNINKLLWLGYQVLGKLKNHWQVKKLAKSVEQWVWVPSGNGNIKREAGWVTEPDCFGRKTRQLAVRTHKKDGKVAVAVLVTTDLTAPLAELVTDYDKRSGLCESSFCQDYQGLGLRKKRKRSFAGQMMLVLLVQLAHNLCVWSKQWLISALSCASEPAEDSTENQLIVDTIASRGIKRLINQVFSIGGRLITKGKKIKAIVLNPFYPLIHRITAAFAALLAPLNIPVCLDET